MMFVPVLFLPVAPGVSSTIERHLETRDNGGSEVKVRPLAQRVWSESQTSGPEGLDC